MLSSWNKVIINIIIVVAIIIILSDYAHAGIQCFLVESCSLLLKNIFFLSSFLQVNWYTQEKFNHDSKYWCLELATGPIAQSVEFPL